MWSYLTTYCHYTYTKNSWLKYDHWVMYKKYTTPLPSYEMWGSKKTSWDGPANKKTFYILVWHRTELRVMSFIFINFWSGFSFHLHFYLSLQIFAWNMTRDKLTEIFPLKIHSFDARWRPLAAPSIPVSNFARKLKCLSPEKGSL